MVANSSDPSANTNQRLPPLQLPGNYPYIEFTQRRDGSWDRQDVTPNNESYSKGHLTGTYHEVVADGGHRELQVATKHIYATQGSTETVDLNKHDKHGGSQVIQTSNDIHVEHGGDTMGTNAGDRINISGGLHFHHATHGTQTTSTGDHVTDHNDGHHHINIEGDQVKFIGGTKYENIGAEYGVYVPNGNIDINGGANAQMFIKGNLLWTGGANAIMLIQDNVSINSVKSNVYVTANIQQNILLTVGPTTLVVNAEGVFVN